MNLNPELRRNLWLELTLHRMIAMPAVLAMVFALIFASSRDGQESVAITAAWIAGLLLGAWGARNAGNCVLEEVRDRTWDAQRLSAIDPWAMTWSKLLGSVSFAWYGGLMALVVLLACAPREWSLSALKLAALILAGSLLAQATACLGGLAAARKGLARRGSMGVWVLIVLLVLAGPGVGLSITRDAGWHWWGERYVPIDFALASATCFAAWAVFGFYRAMCTELQVRTTPWVFAAFTLFLIAYFAGFWIASGADAMSVLRALLLCGVAVASTVTYLQLFTEETGVIVARRVQVQLARRAWRRALEELPCWPVGLAITAVASLAGALLLPAEPGDEGLRRLFAAPIPIFLLLVRDIGIFLFFAFARQPRRVEAAAIFYLVMLYAVIPGLLSAAGWHGVAELVLPLMLAPPLAAAGVAAVHAAAACALLVWRWRSYRSAEGKS